MAGSKETVASADSEPGNAELCKKRGSLIPRLGLNPKTLNPKPPHFSQGSLAWQRPRAPPQKAQEADGVSFGGPPNLAMLCSLFL